MHSRRWDSWIMDTADLVCYLSHPAICRPPSPTSSHGNGGDSGAYPIDAKGSEDPPPNYPTAASTRPPPRRPLGPTEYHSPPTEPRQGPGWREPPISSFSSVVLPLIGGSSSPALDIQRRPSGDALLRSSVSETGTEHVLITDPFLAPAVGLTMASSIFLHSPL